MRRASPDITYDGIWNKPDLYKGSEAQLREVVVQTSTQQEVLIEIRRQLASTGQREAACPCCGAKLPAPHGRAPIVSHDGTLGHLRMYVDMDPILRILRQDVGTASINQVGADQICAALVKRAEFSLTVATCTACETEVLAYPLDPNRVARFYADSEYHASSSIDAETRAPGTAETFSIAYQKSLFPNWVMTRLNLSAGCRAFDFGCGEGTMLKHFDVSGATPSGLDLDRQRAAYARDVLDLQDISDSLDSLSTRPPESFDLVASYHVLEHVTDMDAILSALCRLVAPGGHVAIAVPNGELKVQSNPSAPPVYPMLGGDHVIALTPAALSARLSRHGLETIETGRSPANLNDKSFSVDKRDPLSGLPIWSSKLNDFVLVARKGA